MKYLYLQLLVLWHAALPSTDRPARPAFKAPAAFFDEIREDQLSRASLRESDADDEDEGTSFVLPEGWDDDATDAAFVKGSALLRGEVGIDELTEVTALREHPTVCVEPASPAVPASTGLLGPLGAAALGCQPRFAFALSTVAIVGVAIAFAHHQYTTDPRPDLAKAEPEQHRSAPEQAMSAPRSQGTQVAITQQNIPPDPPATQESASAQVPEAAAATALQRAPIVSPAPVAVVARAMQRHEAVASRRAMSPAAATVPPVRAPEAAAVVATTDPAPAGDPLVATVGTNLISIPLGVFKFDLPMLPRNFTGGAHASTRNAVGYWVAPVTLGAADPAPQTDQAADPLAATFQQGAACDAPDAACSDAFLAGAAKAREQVASLEQRLTAARVELAAATAALERNNDQALVSERAVWWNAAATAQVNDVSGAVLFYSGHGASALVTALNRLRSKAPFANAYSLAGPTYISLGQAWLPDSWRLGDRTSDVVEFSFVNAFVAPASESRTTSFRLVVNDYDYGADTKLRGVMTASRTPGAFPACSVSLVAASAPMCSRKWTKEATLGSDSGLSHAD